MAKDASRDAAVPPRRDPRARTRLTAMDAGICVLLVLTVAGVAAQAILLSGSASLILIAASALSLLVGFARLPLSAAVLGIAAVTVAGAAGAYAVTAAGADVVRFAVSAVIVALLGLIAVWASRRLGRLYRRLREHRRAIETLTQIDPATGVFKPHAGRERLRAEITRALRYHRSFTLLIGKPCDWEREIERRGTSAAQEVFAETVRTATTVLRNNDIVATEPDYSFIVILPETVAEGGEIAAQHIQEAVQGILEVRFGLVQCPEDGETEESLVQEAKQALAFAEMVNLPIVSRRSLIEA